jgi:hypothetical protein
VDRQARVDELVEANEMERLLKMIEWGPCACLGKRPETDPLCNCKMWEKVARETASYAALKRGKIVRLKK